jgi:hypothetical protein
MNFELTLEENKRNFFERELTYVSSERGISSSPIFDDYCQILREHYHLEHHHSVI